MQVQVWAIAVLAVAFLAFAAVGALVAARDPDNGMGWLFISIGTSVAVSLASIYVEMDLPARSWAGWVADLSSVVVFPQIIFVLLLFPEGRLPSPRWRGVAWAGVITALGLMVGTFTPSGPPEQTFSTRLGSRA